MIKDVVVEKASEDFLEITILFLAYTVKNKFFLNEWILIMFFKANKKAKP